MLPEILPSFVPAFLGGLLVNLELALVSMALSLPLGAALLGVRSLGSGVRRAADLLRMVMRATPIFVMMFFLLNTLPRGDGTAWGEMLPFASVIGAMVVYGTAYVADNALVFLDERRKGSPTAAPLFVMGLVRGYFVMVFSSGFAAAVGVVEAISVTIRTLEGLRDPGDRIGLMLVALGILVIVTQTIFWAVNRTRVIWMTRATRSASVA